MFVFDIFPGFGLPKAQRTIWLFSVLQRNIFVEMIELGPGISWDQDLEKFGVKDIISYRLLNEGDWNA